MGEMIVVYNTAYKVLLCVSVLLLGLTVFLFFKFNIINIFKIRSGMAVNKAVRQMEEANQKSAALRYNSVALGERTPALALGASPPERPAKGPFASEAAPKQMPERQAGPAAADEFTAILTETSYPAAGSEPTAVLAEQAPGRQEGGAPTVLLMAQEAPGTESDFTAVLGPSPQNPVVFEITRSIMYIHTDETL
ncbi:MAG: hypothetical protein ACK5L3_12825 [Oscillospiraceae bacterium]